MWRPYWIPYEATERIIKHTRRKDSELYTLSTPGVKLYSLSYSLQRCIVWLKYGHTSVTLVLCTYCDAERMDLATSTVNPHEVQWLHWAEHRTTPPCWRYSWCERSVELRVEIRQFLAPRFISRSRISTGIWFHAQQFAIVREFTTSHCCNNVNDTSNMAAVTSFDLGFVTLWAIKFLYKILGSIWHNCCLDSGGPLCISCKSEFCEGGG